MIPPVTADQLETRYARFPRTRYQGSKRKFALNILRELEHLEFDTVLDIFGGTGAVSYAFKCAGKTVTYNDVLAFNHQIGLALIENRAATLSAEQIAAVGLPVPGREYDDFVERTFRGIYFTDKENHWLDVAVANINAIPHTFERAVAWFALFQAAMAKRPYNLFHRSNLYMRSADVPRSFGNKSSWDRPFAEHFAAFARQAGRAVFDSERPCRARCAEASDVKPGYDLVYFDPPYINSAGVGVDYRDFYHFLEGLMNYSSWAELVDIGSRHRRLRRQPNPWCTASDAADALRALFHHHRESILVVSYRNNGKPSIEELERRLREVKPRVQVIDCMPCQYALSTNRQTRETLLIGTASYA